MFEKVRERRKARLREELLRRAAEKIDLGCDVENVPCICFNGLPLLPLEELRMAFITHDEDVEAIAVQLLRVMRRRFVSMASNEM